MRKLNHKQILEGIHGFEQVLNIEILDSVTSTNDAAKKLLREYPEKFTLVATNKQTAGRGRRGKNFYSELDHGLYFTLAFRPKAIKIENIPLYTLLAAATLVQILESYTKDPLSIKWVNDIFYQGKKISGILSEMVSNETIKKNPGVIVGVGINFAGNFSKTSSEVQNVAGTLFGEQVPETFNQNGFLSRFIQQFYHYHINFLEKEFMGVYEKHLLGIGKEVSYFVKEEKRLGTIQGINDQGHLLVLKPDQTIETLYGQEVHFNSAQFINEI